MARTSGSDDPELSFIENVIGGAGRIITLIDLALHQTDDPEILDRLLDAQKSAIMLQVITRNYRPQLSKLKTLAISTGKDLRSRKSR